MARTPSMVALLGLLAVAGYQNRDKLGELMGGLGNKSGTTADPDRQSGGLGDIIGGLGGATSGRVLSGGLGDLVDQFRQVGRARKLTIGNPGANDPVEASDLEDALGEDTLAELTQKTGLSRE